MSRKVICSSLWVMGLLVLALAASHANAVPCSQAIMTLLPCKDYLVGQANSVTVQCCQGANSLNNMVNTKPDLRSLCECLKQAAAGLRVIVDRAKALPQICTIRVPVPIDPNVDCSSKSI
ncbi:hypothetical protein Pfo_013154, partial [Paulownia fortunei]